MKDLASDVASSAAPDDRLRESGPGLFKWTFCSAGNAERPDVEGFIRRGFQQAYGSLLAQLMPELMVLRRHSQIAAACGLRPALMEKLFLETYLDAPVETILAGAVDSSVARADIVEVGNLVIAQPGYARHLIVHLAACLYARGCRWVVFSAVPALRNSFRRIGIPLVTLAPADARRLSADERARWGTYYDHSPVVTTVNVADAFQAVCEAACTR